MRTLHHLLEVLTPAPWRRPVANWFLIAVWLRWEHWQRMAGLYGAFASIVLLVWWQRFERWRRTRRTRRIQGGPSAALYFQRQTVPPGWALAAAICWPLVWWLLTVGH